MPTLSRSLRLPIWIAGLVLLSMVSACGPTAPEPPDETLRTLALFPSDVQQVAQLNLRQLQADGVLTIAIDEGVELRVFDEPILSPSQVGDESDVLSFLDAAGIDPDRDLHTLTIASSMMGFSRAPLVVVNLTMDREQLTEALLAEGAERSEELATDEIPVFALSEQDLGRPHLALLDESHLLFGEGADVAQALSAEERFMPSPADRALLGHAATGRSAWTVFFSLPDTEDAEMQPTATTTRAQEQETLEERLRELRQLTSVIQQAGMGLRLTDESMQAQVTLAAGDDAADVRRVLRGVVSAAQSSGDLSANQQELLERLSITDQGRFVLVTFDGSTAALRDLLNDL
ncbi:MAG: hypothetical protein GVY12_11180 [Bacteroidetes bacterium]|jgi:hypothetical protein|nr:hypothetical protein [Bacteroidota bacterium]